MLEKTKQCNKCHKVKKLKEFFDESLKTNYGKYCLECKKEPDKPSFPKKICPKCENVVQLHFDIRTPEGRSKLKYVRCPECHSPIFNLKY